METDPQVEAEVLLRECAHALSILEAEYLEDCCLGDAKKTLKAFAEEHGLSQREIADLRVRAMEHLRDKLAEKNINRFSDIL